VGVLDDGREGLGVSAGVGAKVVGASVVGARVVGVAVVGADVSFGGDDGTAVLPGNARGPGRQVLGMRTLYDGHGTLYQRSTASALVADAPGEGNPSCIIYYERFRSCGRKSGGVRTDVQQKVWVEVR
jgi:hypothetical protein